MIIDSFCMIIDSFCSWINQRHLYVVFLDVLEHSPAQVDRPAHCPQKPNVSACYQSLYVLFQLRNARQPIFEYLLNLHQTLPIDREGECS
jgi:hypothetical protein